MERQNEILIDIIKLLDDSYGKQDNDNKNDLVANVIYSKYIEPTVKEMLAFLQERQQELLRKQQENEAMRTLSILCMPKNF